MPPATDTVAYGKYLLSAASCGECHTKQVKGQVVSERFAGSFEFPIPDGRVVVSAYVTPNREMCFIDMLTM